LSKSRKKTAAILYPPDAAEREQEYCHGKLCLSERDAHARINGTKRRQHSNSSKMIPKRVYLCPDCGCYHLTHLAKYDEPYDID